LPVLATLSRHFIKSSWHLLSSTPPAAAAHAAGLEPPAGGSWACSRAGASGAQLRATWARGITGAPSSGWLAAWRAPSPTQSSCFLQHASARSQGLTPAPRRAGVVRLGTPPRRRREGKGRQQQDGAAGSSPGQPPCPTPQNRPYRMSKLSQFSSWHASAHGGGASAASAALAPCVQTARGGWHQLLVQG
jgi:hypothetical protein